MSYLADDKELAKIVANSIKTVCDIDWFNHYSVKLKKGVFDFVFNLLDDSDREIAHFRLVQQINCCGMLVSTETRVNKEYQGKGIAQELLALKEALAKVYGFSSMIATVNMTGNPAEVHILEKYGWSCVNNFKNKRTNNIVGVYIKNLE